MKHVKAERLLILNSGHVCSQLPETTANKADPQMINLHQVNGAEEVKSVSVSFCILYSV